MRRNGRRTNNHRRLIRGLIHTLERRKLVQSKTEWFSQDTNCAQPRCTPSWLCTPSLFDSQDWDLLIPDSECVSLTWKWPPFNLCHLFSFWTFSKLTTKQKVSEQISVMLKLLPASSSLLFCICQKREAGWKAGHEWCFPGLGSLQLGHSHCFSSHYNGYLWLQHLVHLTAQSVSSCHCFSQSPLFSTWLWNKHLAPLYWPKYVVSLLVSLKTKCLFRPATDKNYVVKL